MADDTQTRLEAEQENAASLKALLMIRTRQHDLAWQAERRLSEQLAAERARADVLAAELARARADAADAADLVRARTEAEALSEELARARERFAAAAIVIGAVAESLGWRGLDRRRFRALVAQAGRATPQDGPQAARHAVLLSESRRVLGLSGD